MRHYELNCGQYVLHEDGMPIGPVMDEVAIAYCHMKDDDLFFIKKYGPPETVESWLETAKKAYSAAGELGKRMAAEMYLIKGRLDVHLVNNVIAGRMDSLIELIKRADAIDVSAKELPEGPKG